MRSGRLPQVGVKLKLRTLPALAFTGERLAPASAVVTKVSPRVRWRASSPLAGGRLPIALLVFACSVVSGRSVEIRSCRTPTLTRIDFRFYLPLMIEDEDRPSVAARADPNRQSRQPLDPLTRRNLKGELYRRLPEVETQIDWALTADPARVIECAHIHDHEAPGYLQEEALVYLIRYFRRMDREDLVATLSEILLRRCAKRINEHLKSLEEDVREEAFRQVIVELFTPILDVESDRGDYLQVRFWDVVTKRSVTAFNRAVSEARRLRLSLRMSELVGEEVDESEDAEAGPQASAIREGVVARGISPEEYALLQAALGAVEEPFRTAFVLHYADGWQISSNNPDEPTLSKLFNKTPRTIQNWLRHAEAVLKEWKEDGS
jgi:hypothetical protein